MSEGLDSVAMCKTRSVILLLCRAVMNVPTSSSYLS